MWFSGLSNPQDYLTQANARTMTIAMCETREAIANLPDILRVPGIDGILVGPATSPSPSRTAHPSIPPVPQ